ncbi:uberolysin/carnocyclin family circular bacteriocin [Virgibacillus proomii]|uniref:uberolysin/carnocyclin family circular bacteriocin n=1 Tax=Virgibacillus proomii TaxID=84407 RepID=UPI000987997D|nr:uberolysin/carnocyclin family circular bacteriocin [Virgibacillus proomii]
MENVLDLVSSMGISHDTAKKVVDMVNAGASAWSIAALIISSGGIIGMGYAALVLLIKRKLKKLGEAAVVAW